MDNWWGNPDMLPGPPKGGLRTREDSWRDRVPLIGLIVIVLAMIVVPLVLAAVAR